MFKFISILKNTPVLSKHCLGISPYFMVNDPPVSLPVSGSRKASLRQQRVGNPTSYLIPTIFISSCSYNTKNSNYLCGINYVLMQARGGFWGLSWILSVLFRDRKSLTDPVTCPSALPVPSKRWTKGAQTPYTWGVLRSRTLVPAFSTELLLWHRTVSYSPKSKPYNFLIIQNVLFTSRNMPISYP